jgi:hypothetical protein
MATRPATRPETKPSIVGRSRCHHSTPTQDRAAAAAETWVVTKASAATPLAPRALPALKPNQPNHRSPPPVHGHREVVRRVLLAGIVHPLADVERADEGGDAGGEVDDGAAREVEHAEAQQPAVFVPRPVRDGIVDERRPQEREHHVRGELHPLDERAGDQRGRDDGELHLEGHEREVWDRAVRLGVDALREQIVEARR